MKMGIQKTGSPIRSGMTRQKKDPGQARMTTNMDILQIAIVFLIVIVAILLSVMGLQVFLVMRGLKRSLDKFENIVGNVVEVTQDIKKPIHAVASMSGAVDAGVKIAKAIASKKKQVKRTFKKITKE